MGPLLRLQTSPHSEDAHQGSTSSVQRGLFSPNAEHETSETCHQHWSCLRARNVVLLAVSGTVSRHSAPSTGQNGLAHFIGCSVSHLHVLVGNRTVVPQKHKISQNCSMKNLKTHFLWIEHGPRIQMSPKKPHIWYNGWEKGSF